MSAYARIDGRKYDVSSWAINYTTCIGVGDLVPDVSGDVVLRASAGQLQRLRKVAALGKAVTLFIRSGYKSGQIAVRGRGFVELLVPCDSMPTVRFASASRWLIKRLAA